MLAMLAQEPSSLAPRQRLERLLPMAGFQVSMYGRFWVSTEGSNDFFTLSHTNHARHKDYAPSQTKEAMCRDRPRVHMERRLLRDSTTTEQQGEERMKTTKTMSLQRIILLARIMREG
jgi:hypothetical protein